MRTIFLLTVVASMAGCAADKAAIRDLIDGEQEQTRLLAERNALLVQQTELLAQSIESQKHMVEMLADVDRSLREIRKVQAEKDRAEEGKDDDKPKPQPQRVAASEPGKTVLGRSEWAWVELLGRNLKARVDTGALSASLNATDLQPFERDGNDWIRFRVPDEDHPDGGELYETPLLNYVLIRQASAEELERRPVVKLTVRVGELIDDIEFSLTDREDMNYPMLLGRDFLRDVALVDVSRRFTQKKHKPEAAAVESAEAE